MNVVDDSPGVVIMSALEVEEKELESLKYMMEIEEEAAEDDTLLQSSLSSHIQSVYRLNMEARQSSGIEQKMLESLRAYNGHYDPEDVARIKQTGGSDIYMNITPTKCRAAMSWIRDILMPANENVFSLSPTPMPEIPSDVVDRIRNEIETFVSASQEEQPVEGQEQPKKDPIDIAQKLHETNQLQADIEEAINDEIYRIASKAVKKFEVTIADELAEGDWDQALSEFIEDFCVFQVALMKGPIITRRRGLTWVGGKPTPHDDYIYMNKRVSPLDIYPSPSATSIQDGDLCEHIRLHRKELYNLVGTEGYKDEYIKLLLKENTSGTRGSWLDSSIEEEKVIEEYRGDSMRANENVFHGIHYHGTACYYQLKDWGYPEEELGDDEDKEFDIEAILVGNHVIKCSLNDDPLLRRPYYKSSFQNIPGSWWGRSLPELMRDIQRVCNATARALANNMGLSSGPQIEVNIDRLAADEEIESIYPFKIWQVTNDPTGAGGKAVTFYQPNSNAGELLAVYKEFELRADDATGIPKYAHGNERTGGAAQTASGLSMLLESASKGIKDAIRHIDDGLIKPRIEYQFYWDMMTSPDTEFTGDIKIIAKGSGTLTTRAAQEARRREFLQILSSPIFVDIIGSQGIGEILREMAKTIGLSEDIVPSRIALRVKEKQRAAMQAQIQQQQAQQSQGQQQVGIQQVQMQTQQADAANQRNAQLKQLDIQTKSENSEKDRQIRLFEIQKRDEAVQSKNIAALQKEEMVAAQRDRSDNKSIALSVQSGYQDKSNIE